jgi:hypothetical protein
VSDLVTLSHPSLPADQTIRVDRRRIGPRLAAGWGEAPPVQPVVPATESEPTESAPEETQQPTGTSAPEPTESAPKRQRRKITEEQ